MSEQGDVTGQQMRVISQQIVTRESTADTDSETINPVINAFDTLRLSLSRLVGVQGFRVLAARALTLTTPKEPSLITITVQPDGSLAGFSDLSEDEITGGVELIAQLLGLLATFVGEQAMLGVLRSAWPDLDLASPKATQGAVDR